MLEYTRHFGPITGKLLNEVRSLADLVFNSAAIDYAWRLSNMPQASVFYVTCNEKLVGFKAGYAISENRYCSWLGAIHPDFRKQGIASALTKAQHEWLSAQGYAFVETACREGNAAMARINLAHGFSVVGTKLEPHALQVLWAKAL